MRILEGLDWRNGHDYIENNRKLTYIFLSNQLQDQKLLDTGILVALEYA